MLTMLLVEDEALERASLRSCIDWELVGVRIIDEAANGVQGIAKVMELHPDIVLTDIKMPVMDGIEMSKKIRDVAPDTKILFISSYDDFEYARQAVNLQAVAYVTKPVNEGELLKIVKRAADEITENVLEQNLNNKLKSNYEVNLNLARQAVVNRAVTGLNINAEDAARLGLDWLCSNPERLCLVLGVFKKDKTEAVDAKISILNHKIKRLFSQSVCACINAGVLVIIVTCGDEIGDSELMDLKEAVRGFLRESGCVNPRLEAAIVNDQSISPADLYLQLLQSDSGIMTPVVAASSERKNKQQIVNEILQIVHTQYHTPLTIESIAKALHYTPNYIGTVFKTVKNISFNRYINSFRLEKATDFLQNTDIHIDEIALQCGYDNITYFYTVFKKEYGITPGEYRQTSR